MMGFVMIVALIAVLVEAGIYSLGTNMHESKFFFSFAVFMNVYAWLRFWTLWMPKDPSVLEVIFIILQLG